MDVVANRGYFKAEDVEACEKVGCVPHVSCVDRGDPLGLREQPPIMRWTFL
jgi:hypothetical protein